jgi:hypothetical protein
MKNPFRSIAQWTSGLGRHPGKDWRLLLATLAFGIVALALVDGFINMRLLSKEIIEEKSETAPTVTIDRKAISETVVRIQEKERNASSPSSTLLRDPSN